MAAGPETSCFLHMMRRCADTFFVGDYAATAADRVIMNSGQFSRIDVYLTHAVLNTAYAGYQGKFTALNMLSQLGFGGVDQENLVGARRTLELVGGWLNRLWQGEAFLTTVDRKPISRDAGKIWKLFFELKKELKALAEELKVFRRVPDAAQNHDAGRYLLACLGRFAYGREHYIKGLLKYGEVFGPPEEAERWRQGLSSCCGELQRLHHLFDRLRACKGDDSQLFEQLRQCTLKLPGAFLAQKHDMNVVVGIARGGLTYDLAEISAEDATVFETFGVDPQAAGYWVAHDIGPEDTRQWISLGFSEPGAAATWWIHDFPPEAAAEWRSLDFDPRTAARWVEQGFTDATNAAAWQQFGFKTPEEAAIWGSHGFGPPDAGSWNAARFTPSEAQEWKASGAANPIAARRQQQTLCRLTGGARPWPDNASPRDRSLGVRSGEIGGVTLNTVDLKTPSPFEAKELLGAFLQGEVPRRDPLGGLSGAHQAVDSSPPEPAPAEPQPRVSSRFANGREFVHELSTAISQNKLGDIVRTVADGAMLIDATDVEVFQVLVDLVTRAPTSEGQASSVRGTSYLLDTLRESEHTTEDAALEVACLVLHPFHHRIGPTLAPGVRVLIATKLAAAFLGRHRAERKSNIEQANRALQSLVDVATRSDQPLLWASVKHAQGSVFLHRGRPGDVENALQCFREVLQVYTPRTRPLDWALAQIDLGDTLRALVDENRDQNVEDALECYQNALNILNPRSNPVHCARAIQRQALAYLERRRGNQTAQQLKAIEKLTDSLRSFRPDSLDAARSHLALGKIYHRQTSGDRTQNLKKAIAHYTAALEVFRQETYLEEWRTADENRTNAIRDGGPLASGIQRIGHETLH